MNPNHGIEIFKSVDHKRYTSKYTSLSEYKYIAIGDNAVMPKPLDEIKSHDIFLLYLCLRNKINIKLHLTKNDAKLLNLTICKIYRICRK